MKGAFYAAGYLGAVLGVNVAFAHAPELAPVWSVAVGAVFVLRDLAQRRMGHGVLALMAAGIALSWWLADPFVAIASAAAFAASEAIDWAVFTITRRPLRDRILWSCLAAAPADSLLFLGLVGILGPGLLALQIGAKILAGLLVWAMLPRGAR